MMTRVLLKSLKIYRWMGLRCQILTTVKDFGLPPLISRSIRSVTPLRPTPLYLPRRVRTQNRPKDAVTLLTEWDRL